MGTFQSWLDPTNSGDPSGTTPGVQTGSASLGAFLFTPNPAVSDDVDVTPPYALVEQLSFTVDGDVSSLTFTGSATVLAIVREPPAVVLALSGLPLLVLGSCMRRRNRPIIA